MSLQDRAGLQASDVNRGDKAQSSSEQVTTFEEVGEILDDWNLGMLNRNHSEFSRSSNTDMEYYLKVLRILPTRQNSTQIVDFSLRTLGWVHCAVRTDDFLATHNIFQDALESGTMQVLQDHEWMAIYFSILAVSLQLVHISEYPLTLRRWDCST